MYVWHEIRPLFFSKAMIPFILCLPPPILVGLQVPEGWMEITNLFTWNIVADQICLPEASGSTFRETFVYVKINVLWNCSWKKGLEKFELAWLGEVACIHPAGFVQS